MHAKTLNISSLANNYSASRNILLIKRLRKSQGGGFIAHTNKTASSSLVRYGVALGSPKFLTPSTQYSTLLKVDSINFPVNPSLMTG